MFVLEMTESGVYVFVCVEAAGKTLGKHVVALS